jgi:hypothetical protein
VTLVRLETILQRFSAIPLPHEDSADTAETLYTLDKLFSASVSPRSARMMELQSRFSDYSKVVSINININKASKQDEIPSGDFMHSGS